MDFRPTFSKDIEDVTQPHKNISRVTLVNK